MAGKLIAKLAGLGNAIVGPYDSLPRNSDQLRKRAELERQNSLKIRPFEKESRICIVGGGPSAIHMASMLTHLGFVNIVILEKNSKMKGRFGKTWTAYLKETGTTPHEMGTCYLSWSYRHTRRLLRHYLGPHILVNPGVDKSGAERFGRLHLPAPELNKQKGYKVLTADQWLFSSMEKTRLPKGLWDWTPIKLQGIFFRVDVQRYRELHESILGLYDYHGLPPEPKDEAAMKLLDMTFRELMLQHSLKDLLDLCCIGFGSYGLGYNIPALYGLWFVTPVAVEAYIAQKLDGTIHTVELVRSGYGMLWERMVKKDGLKIRYDIEIDSINRNLEDCTKRIEIKLKNKEKVSGKSSSATKHDAEKKTKDSGWYNADVIEADFLIFAAPMQQAFQQLVKDATDFEKKVCEDIQCVDCNVCLFKTAKKEGEGCLTFYPESLQPEFTKRPDGEVYAERNIIRCYCPEKEKDTKFRYTAAYQHFTKPQTGKSKEIAEKSKKFITDETKTVNPTPAKPEPELVHQAHWDNYFPHFSVEGIVKERLPWRVFETQGKNRTWYIGSSVSFESIEDITNYNIQLLESQGFGKKIAFPPKPSSRYDPDNNARYLAALSLKRPAKSESKNDKDPEPEREDARDSGADSGTDFGAMW